VLDSVPLRRGNAWVLDQQVCQPPDRRLAVGGLHPSQTGQIQRSVRHEQPAIQGLTQNANDSSSTISRRRSRPAGRRLSSPRARITPTCWPAGCRNSRRLWSFVVAWACGARRRWLTPCRRSPVAHQTGRPDGGGLRRLFGFPAKPCRMRNIRLKVLTRPI
jgi:hypothetical protein